MSFDPVPWMIGGGAEHSAEVGRLLAYAAFRGNEGVLGASDLAVTALPTPGLAVNIGRGACGILSRATGGQYQTYAGRVPGGDTVPIAGVGSGGRTDMIVARVEDPNPSGEPWANPSDVRTGPYIFTRVIPNVPSNATSVQALNLGYSAIPLARINIPANATAITNSMITDLRFLANPRRERKLLTMNVDSYQISQSAGNWLTMPYAAWAVNIPKWASLFAVTWQINGTRVFRESATVAGGAAGATRVGIYNPDSEGDFQITQGSAFDITVPPSVESDRYVLAGADTRPLLSSQRGALQTLRIENVKNSGETRLTVDTGTSYFVDIEFVEGPI